MPKRKLLSAKTSEENEGEPKKPKKKKKIEEDNRTWTTKSQGNNSDGKGNLINIRANTQENFITPEGNKENVRTSMLINRNSFEKNTSEADKQALISYLDNRLIPKFKKSVKTFRAWHSIIECNINGSPTKIAVYSPSKKGEYPVLSRVHVVGDFSFYCNIPNLMPLSELKTVDSISEDNPFFKSDRSKEISKIHGEYKLVNIKVTPELFKETKKEMKRTGGQRTTSQAKIMRESANQHAEETKLFSFKNMKWEWLHLIAHQILGTYSQDQKNIVGGGASANTLMLFVELNFPYLAKKYPEGFDLCVKAHMIKGTKIATLIEYTIITPDFTLPLFFITQDPNRPHAAYYEYLKESIHALAEYGASKKEMAEYGPSKKEMKSKKKLTFEEEPEKKSTYSEQTQTLFHRKNATPPAIQSAAPPKRPKK